MDAALAQAWAAAVAAKDWAAVAGLVADDIDFRGMTPGRIWEASDPDGVVDILGQWFEPTDHVEAVDAVETDAFADRQRSGYRLQVRNGDGLHLVEQQAYLGERDGRIAWARVVCSGFRPVEG